MFSLENNLTKNSNILDIKVKNYGECGYCVDTENKVILNIPWSIWSQWMYVSQHMRSKEWGCVFWVKDNTVTNFKIPKQEVSVSECEFKEELGGDGIVHSHHNMGAFHSPQDDEHARNLYCYSIVLSNARGCEATKRMKLPCEGFGYVKVELQLIECPEIELSKITERKDEFMPEIYHRENHQQQLDFETAVPCDKCASHKCDNCQVLNTGYIPCDRCESLKCKECRFAIARDIGEILPFCEFCEDYDFCSSCSKLAKYLENYPEDRQNFEYLFTNQM